MKREKLRASRGSISRSDELRRLDGREDGERLHSAASRTATRFEPAPEEPFEPAPERRIMERDCRRAGAPAHARPSSHAAPAGRRDIQRERPVRRVSGWNWKP